jgi:hypothetical protein
MERIPPHINNSSQQGHHEHEPSPYFQGGVGMCPHHIHTASTGTRATYKHSTLHAARTFRCP